MDEELRSLRTFAARNQSRLFTELEFREELERLLASMRTYGLEVHISVRTVTGQELASYRPAVVSPFATDSDPLGQFEYSVHAAYFREVPDFNNATARALFDEIKPLLRSILESFWGARDGLTVLYRDKESANLRRLNEILREWAENQLCITVLHFDLDYFKKVNTEFGETIGDKVLAEFGVRIRRAFGALAILIRKGGEEFSVFIQSLELPEALKLARDFRISMARDSFNEISRPNTCSIGVAVFPHHYSTVKDTGQSWFQYLLGPAMAAETRAKECGRNCISLPALTMSPSNDAMDLEERLRLSVIASRLGWFGGSDGFQNDFQRSVAAALHSRLMCAGCDLIAEIDQTKQEFALQLAETAPSILFTETLGSPQIHPIIWLTIVMHALFKASFAGGELISRENVLRVSLKGDSEHSVIQVQLGTRTLSLDLNETQTIGDKVINFGKPWLDSSLGVGLARRQHVSQSPVLLLKIGSVNAPNSLNSAFAGILEIDDRPVTGGGLPDFWQSNLSRLLYLAEEFPNVTHLMLLGDTENAKRTIEFLKSVDQWDLGTMTRRLSVDFPIIQDYQSRHLQILQSAGESKIFIMHLNEIFISDISVAGSGTAKKRAIQHQRLNAVVDQPSLLPADGIQCVTAAEAYPRIISILRSPSISSNVDHLGRKFSELTSFKLALDKPLEDKIPDYWAEDAKELSEYFDQQFGSNGLFGSRIRRWGGRETQNQLEYAITECAQSIQKRFANRRIMLFIADSGDDLGSPLGLVCAQILPRFVDGRWTASFNWIWRTVEALVGLPFSLYGSIACSEQILASVNSRLIIAGHTQVSMGRLTYVAMSLHMFTDEGDQHIARAIVTAAI